MTLLPNNMEISDKLKGFLGHIKDKPDSEIKEALAKQGDELKLEYKDYKINNLKFLLELEGSDKSNFSLFGKPDNKDPETDAEKEAREKQELEDRQAKEDKERTAEIAKLEALRASASSNNDQVKLFEEFLKNKEEADRKLVFEQELLDSDKILKAYFGDNLEEFSSTEDGKFFKSTCDGLIQNGQKPTDAVREVLSRGVVSTEQYHSPIREDGRKSYDEMDLSEQLHATLLDQFADAVNNK